VVHTALPVVRHRSKGRPVRSKDLRGRRIKDPVVPRCGWNRHWDGPDRGIDQGRFDHQPFDYDDYQAVPIWSPDMGGWGFWFFGVWIPL
jgi:hypothetical protein